MNSVRHIGRRRQRGLTLAEVLVSMTVLAIIMSIALPAIVVFDRAERAGQEESDARNAGLAAAMFLSRELRSARRFTDCTSSADTHGQVEFDLVDSSGTRFRERLYFDPDAQDASIGYLRQRKDNLTTGAVTDARVAGPITGLTFAAYNEDGATQVTSPNDIRFVDFILDLPATDSDAAPMVRSAVAVPPARPLWAVFSSRDVSLTNSSQVTGDVFTGGAFSSDTTSSVTGGLVYPVGMTSGTGFTSASPPSPTPSLPPLDTTYYDNLMTQAWAVAPGDFVLNHGTLDLAGSTLLVNGSVKLGGGSELTSVSGPGLIVATNTIEVKGNATLSGDIRAICQWDLIVASTANILNGVLLFAYHHVDIQTGDAVDGDIVAGDWVKVQKNAVVNGLVYLSTSATIEGAVNGALYAQGPVTLNGGTVTYTEANLGRSIPGLTLR